ncbi:MAG: hypothetical protein WCF08_03600 [Anaerolineaceae bacterium]
MNIQSNKHRNALPVIVTGILIASLMIALIPMGTVRADSPSQEGTPTTPINKGKGSALLEKALQREQKVNANLVGLFEKADKAISKLQDAIQNGKTNGKDVKTLKEALDEINNQITSARVAHDKAAGLLNRPAGFDDTGKVTDAKLAVGTIREIGEYQREARHLIGDSIKDAVRAIREFRQDNQVK